MEQWNYILENIYIRFTFIYEYCLNLNLSKGQIGLFMGFIFFLKAFLCICYGNFLFLGAPIGKELIFCLYDIASSIMLCILTQKH